MSSFTPKLFVISGPSGAGKGTLLARVREHMPQLGLTVSATTRAPRVGEVDGVSYHFLTPKEFERRVCAGEFLEWAQVHEHCYGTLLSDVKEQLASGSSVMLEIDVQGALQVKDRYPDAVLIFIEPPTLNELRRRLESRGTESAQSIDTRMANAVHELELASRYDERIINDELNEASASLISLLTRYERS
ncbi:guanylate kinase [Collinsella sp. zg1085]|uniref:guanylate kinase n=1 Tax=Collinsella sp. zg1085 TaxID=2844380 RepID=UPI001C0B1868|nr:guanylate kinase [Collinsella sp. zg1085]QWT16970.1 guanylate kinase [Collinsella sp. zg1085]